MAAACGGEVPLTGTCCCGDTSNRSESRSAKSSSIRFFSSSRRTKRFVRGLTFPSELIEKLGQARLSIRRRFPDVDEPGLISRETVLIFKAGYLHIRRDPPVLLPVNPNEDLTLLQIRSVECPRRVGPSPLLEHDRCKPKVADPLPGGVAFLPQFSKGRTHKHPQPLIGSPDHSLSSSPNLSPKTLKGMV